LDPDTLVLAVSEYLHNRSMRERSAYHEDRVKKDLMAILEVAGEQTSDTTQSIGLAPLPWTKYKEGKPVQTKVVGIERRKRTSSVMDEDKAMALIHRKGLVKDCLTTIVVVNEDAVLAANYAGTITDKELAALYEEKTTYAFYPTEES